MSLAWASDRNWKRGRGAVSSPFHSK